MAPFSNADLQNRFSSRFKTAADRSNLTLDRSAQDSVGALIADAAERLGSTESAEDVGRAEASFERLAARLGASDLRHSDRISGRHLPSEVPVTQRDVARVMDALCPGFWPFC